MTPMRPSLKSGIQNIPDKVLNLALHGSMGLLAMGLVSLWAMGQVGGTQALEPLVPMASKVVLSLTLALNALVLFSSMVLIALKGKLES